MHSARKAPPRRKACSECIKSKRRCDLVLPSCARCRKLQLDCNYGASTRILQPSEALLPSLRDTPEASIDTVASASASQGETLVDSVAPSLENSNDLDTYPLLPEFDSSLSVDAADANAPVQVESDYSLARLVIDEFAFSSLSAIVESRFKHAIDLLKSSPMDMVLKAQTPWIHPLLYETEMPRLMQDAHAACALYITKNETNSSFIFRHVVSHLDGLLATPAPIVPLGLLARAQALLLYCIILTFDGGIRERVRADAALAHLEGSARAIHPFVGVVDSIPEKLSYYPTTASTSVWKTWIFRESIRRTFIASFAFISIYRTMKEEFGFCQGHAALGTLLTASAHLWRARNVMDFATAWNERKHYVLQNVDFTDLIANGHADDLDEFGKSLLVAYMGADEAKGWLHAHGGAL